MPDLNQSAEWRQQFALDAVLELQATALPWFGHPKTQNRSVNEPLDLLAQWYLEFADAKDLNRWLSL